MTDARPRWRFGFIYCADRGRFLRLGWSRYRMDGRLIDKCKGECPMDPERIAERLRKEK